LARLAEHETKVRMEEIKDEPDQELIKHWKAEISAFGKSIERARRRLGR
jgi:recombinational DNA repair ATPase RecF